MLVNFMNDPISVDDLISALSAGEIVVLMTVRPARRELARHVENITPDHIFLDHEILGGDDTYYFYMIDHTVTGLDLADAEPLVRNALRKASGRTGNCSIYV